MEIINEVRAKVFAPYIGVECEYKWNREDQLLFGKLTPRIFESLYYDDGVITYCKIKLKPLSVISDEDAAEVSKICYKEKFRKIIRYHDHIELEIDNLNDLRIYFNTEIKTAWRETISCKDIESDEQLLTYIKCIDYLRSKGYDIPHYLLGGKTLEQSGLAIYEK